MNLSDFNHIYFVGIGGIGMSAVARYLHSLGKHVSGYDKTSTNLTSKLMEEGMSVGFVDDVATLPVGIELVVYTPAIPKENKILNHYLDNDIPVIKRSQALGLVSNNYKTIAVAGTHGKTSTSSIIAGLLEACGVPFTAFLGGIAHNFASNYYSSGSEWMVVEADEYDRSFLWLSPKISVLLSMDADHLDIYGNVADMHTGFWSFVSGTKENGVFIYRSGLEKYFPPGWQLDLERKKISIFSFGIDEGDAYAESVKVADGKFEFEYSQKNIYLGSMQSALPGRHNIENAVAAITSVLDIVPNKGCIAAGLKNFRGIYRRFERMYEGKVIYIDDYAHHPSELNAVIGAVKELYPAKPIYGVFQPHLYSRTRDFAREFAESLEVLNGLILMPIYPAREKPIAGVSSEIIIDKMKTFRLFYVDDHNEALEAALAVPEGSVLLTLGAGDIDLLRDKIVNGLRERFA